jgi:hypothetical protein
MKALMMVLTLVPSMAWAADYLEQVESDVFESAGTAQEILARAKSCIAQNVRNDEVRISDSASSGGPIPMPSMGTGHSDGITGGDVISSVDPDTGTITANCRVDYQSNMLAHNVKSTLTFFAKDGKFKIRHTNIEYLQKSTGSMQNSGYSRVGKWWGSGWKAAQTALESVSAKVSKCVQDGPNSQNW